MKHRCRACSREFTDDSEPLPHSSCVHCVFCGAAIPLPSAGTSAPPFSSEVTREAGFALGVLAGAGGGFPDTLRQFRVRTPAARPSPKIGDSLSPLSEGLDSPSAVRRTWRGPPIWVSLGVGFAVGGLLARGAVSLRSSSPSEGASASASLAASTTAVSPRAGGALPPLVSPVPSAMAVAPVAPAAPSARTKPKVTIADERRFFLERARGEQRHYRLAEAEQLYRRVLARTPLDSEALAGLGELELLRGTTDLAEARFRDALKANADYVPARIAMADLAWNAGQVATARRAYRDIVDQYPSDLYPPYVAQRSELGEPARDGCER